MAAERTRSTRTQPGFTRLSCDWRAPNLDPCGTCLDGSDAGAARAAARELGWVREAGRDLCPRHTPADTSAHPTTP